MAALALGATAFWLFAHSVLKAWGSQGRARLRHFGGQVHFECNT